jgi:hypothetical protein
MWHGRIMSDSDTFVQFEEGSVPDVMLKVQGITPPLGNHDLVFVITRTKKNGENEGYDCIL